MAILNSIRKHSIFLIAIIALALFAFVIGDIIRQGGFDSGSQTSVGTIDGVDIDREQFSRKVENARQRFGQAGSTTQAVNYAWDQEMRAAVLSNQFEALGLDAGPAQVKSLLKQALQNNQLFIDDNGQFSELKLQEYMNTLRTNDPAAYQQWKDFLNGLQTSGQETNFMEMLKAGLMSTDSEGEAAYRLANDKRTIQYVYAPFSSIPDSTITVSEEEIRSYIKSHPEQFKVEPLADLEYVLFEDNASQADITALKSNVAMYGSEFTETVNGTDEQVAGLDTRTDYEAFLNIYSDTKLDDSFKYKAQFPATVSDSLFTQSVGSIYGPYEDAGMMKLTKVIEKTKLADSIKSSYILVAYEGASRSQSLLTRDEAKAVADSILPLVRRSNSAWNAAAKEYNTDGSGDTGGELGWTVRSTFRGGLDQDYADYIFRADKGEVELIETAFGWHIIRVDDKQAYKDAIKVATLTKSIQPSEETSADLFNRVQKFQKAAMATDDFSSVLKENNLTVRPVRSLRSFDDNIPGIGSNREIVKWVYQADTELGDIKRIDLPNGDYAIVRVTRKTGKGLMPVSDASVTVTPILRNQKKAEILRAKFTGSGLDVMATNVGQAVQTASALTRATPTIPGAGSEPLVIGHAFGMAQEAISAPIVGNTGVYVIKVMGIEEAPALDNYTADARRLDASNVAVNTNAVIEALKTAAEISDNRSTFY